MGTQYAFPEHTETMDPRDVDLARRLQVAFGRRGQILSETDAVDIARELSGVDPYWA